jgi:hypothetical protein
VPDDARTDSSSSSAPRPSPGTDPTNPQRQENVGEWTHAERQNERRNDAPGLTDRDRQDRDPAH